MLTHDAIAVVDFGSQTAQLIARRVRELGVLSKLISPLAPVSELRAMNPRGIILSGGPASVYEPGAPQLNPEFLKLGVPVLGICYGMQAMCRALGSTVIPGKSREFGRASLHVTDDSDILAGIPENSIVWMSHGDQVADLDRDFQTLATTPTVPHAAARHRREKWYAVLFHPEVTHTPCGLRLFENFLFNVCGCRGDWKMADFLEEQVASIRRIVGSDRVICGLSGGVDSSVVAALLHRAIGDQLTCVFVDNGLLRKNERTLVEKTFRDHFRIDLRVADASHDFLSDLAGITDPQEKRKRIGRRFIEVFKHSAKEIQGAKFLAQGTLYPDVIESGHGHAGQSANIKLHHNVGGLPPKHELGFDLIEPVRDLFKDEVRKLGEVLGLPSQLIWRHPFPGPGLAVRVLGEVREDRLSILRDCDEILIEEITAADWYRRTSQVFAVLLPVKSVGVMGDGRTYDSVVAIRAVETQDFMTADWAHLPHELLARISSRIINEVRGVNRVVYDISSKPPATIEWE
ncbi:MAG TPA: glutamine-hydrolyzing GMP synthase [Phycisphaerales bacterium]|nr:glutamine-hydrolyzing GMP synthase [Phycisphaerales bacterium]